jgi:hypothetical protein
VHGNVASFRLVEEGVEAARPLDARDLDPVVRAVGEALLGGRELVQVGGG